jgi:ABC-type sugar transport system substrate-binding protein
MLCRSSWRAPLSLAVLVCSALLFAACGGNSSDNNTTSSGGATKSASATRSASLVPAPPTTPVTEFPITEGLGGSPPKKSIAWLACELPTCQEMLSDGYKTAAAALGWNFKQINYKVSDPASAVQQALDDNVDYIAITGIPTAAFPNQAKEAAKRHIPIVSCFDITKPAPKLNGLYMQCADTYGYGLQAKQIADWMINDSQGKANIVMVNIEDYPILQAERKAIQSEFKEKCPNCKFDLLPVTVDDVGGGKVPAKVAAYVQSHPNLSYVELGFSDLGLGIPQALKAAGVQDKVKITGVQSNAAVLKDIVKGNIAAWTAQAQEFAGWMSLDALARLSKKMPLTEYENSGQLPSWVVDSPQEAQKVLDGPGQWPGPEGFQEKFKKLWGV